MQQNGHVVATGGCTLDHAAKPGEGIVEPTASTQHESNGGVMAGGLVVVLFGGFSVLLVALLGHGAGLVFGAVYLLIARRVRTSVEARSARWLVAGFGVVALALGALSLFG